MSMKNERIFFMTDYAGNLTAVPESQTKQFGEAQEELKRRIAAGEDMEKPDPRVDELFEKLLACSRISNSDTKETTQKD